jgi:hypothetical protein
MIALCAYGDRIASGKFGRPIQTARCRGLQPVPSIGNTR